MSIRRIWRETMALFWGHPLLWVPVLGADLLSFFLTKLQKFVADALIYRWLLDRSVFGGARSLPEPSSNGLVFKAAMVGGSLDWGMHFIHILLYAIALFVTASLVRTITRRESGPPSSLVQSVRSRRRAILGLSLRVFGVVALFAISLGALIAFTISQTRKYMIHSPMGLIYILSVAAFCGMAYFAAPMAMRRVGTTGLSSKSIGSGRTLAMLAVVVSSLLGYCLPYGERSFVSEPLLSGAFAVATAAAIVSLVVSIPYIVLFIALTVIVDRDTELPHNDGPFGPYER